MVLEIIVEYAANLIYSTGYLGMLILMAAESTVLPVPSEAVMPLAGLLVSDGRFNLGLVILATSIGTLLGSLISFFIGSYLGKPVLALFARYGIIKTDHVQWTERWFKKNGYNAVFIARFIPVVRHLISIVAGTWKINWKKFSVYTMAGAIPWNIFLLYVGIYTRENWTMILEYMKYLDYLVIIILIAAVVFHFGIQHRKKSWSK